MRPSRRLLIVAGLLVAASLAILAFAQVPPATIIVAWGALMAALVIDATTTPGAKRFTVEAPETREFFVGETTKLRFALVARERVSRVPAAGGPVRFRLAWPSGIEGPAEFGVSDASQDASATITVRGVRRGDYRPGEVAVLRLGRLKLLDHIAFYPVATRLVVTPNLRRVTSGDIDLQIATETFGARAALNRGEGSEFHQLRDFVSGMDSRAIDYKRSARHRNLVAREMRAERNHNIVLAMDNGHLMREEIAGLAKIDHMIDSAMALAWAAVKGGDLVGLYAFDARPRIYVPPGGGMKAFSHLRTRVAELEYRSVETNHTLAMTHLGQKLNRRSLVIVFSDFVDTTTAELLVENVAVLNRHHVVVFVSLRDPLLSDMTRHAASDLGAVASVVAAAGLERERRAVLDRLSRLGVFVIDARPGEVSARLISTYLRIRERELI
ncbi:DUF58 domain-containing protein [Afifella aestuarii]|uniref:DUF58 domain-containing protein n=1 Tax=Afifella aestuarii TaxID=1909496 RepID=UPI000FE3BC7C|nr:DUF58 domain-containing protein [Afifella aestuarii]